MKRLLTILSLFFSLAAAGQFGQAQLLKPTTQLLPEALNYIQRVEAAGRTLTVAEKLCINDNLIKPLISNGIWTKIHDAGPPIWGAAAPSMVSLKAAATLTAIGSPVWNNTGVDFDGLNSSLKTNVIPSLHLQLNSLHVGYYSRETTAAGVKIMIGSETSTNGDMISIVPRNNTNQIRFAVNNLTYYGTNTNSTTLGFYLANRSGAAALQMYKNGAAAGTSTAASTALPGNPIGIGAGITNAAVPFAHYDGECAFWTVGASLTASEAQTYFNIVESFLDCIGIGVVP